MTTQLLGDTATVQFSLTWESEFASHEDRLWAQKVNFWRDEFPNDIEDHLLNQDEGGHLRAVYQEGDLLPSSTGSKIRSLSRADFSGSVQSGGPMVPKVGRFYPRGMLSRGLGVTRQDLRPLRCIGLDESTLTADLNHPLSGRNLNLTATTHRRLPKRREVGGACVDWSSLITDGPGMQARWNGIPTEFFSGDPFRRRDERDDTLFYRDPRLVGHIDAEASRNIAQVYGRFLHEGMNVLDVMSSWQSHVPDDVALDSLVGLGLNEKELTENPRLTEHLRHDLNRSPTLPFPNEQFDAVLCTVSVEYMTRPPEVFADVARILRPGGYFVATFSNRWFPPKVIGLWEELHDFERMGLVLEYFLSSRRYDSLGTYSIRGMPRPTEDKYYPQLKTSDPVYAVWGRKA